MSTHLDESTERAKFISTVATCEGFYVHCFCDLCDAKAEGLRETLRLRGWTITPRESWCPKHSEGE